MGDQQRRPACIALLALVTLAWVTWSAAAPAQELPRDIGEETSGFDNATADLLAPVDERVTALAGRPVLGVSVETTGRRWQSKPVLASVPLGAPLSPELARAALRELVASGAFAQAYADAREYQDGVILRVVALPRRIAAEVLLDAAAVPTQRVRTALGIATGGEITEPILRDVRSRVLELYRRHGFDRARVTITTSDTDDPLKVLVKVVATAGPARRVSRRIFVVEPVFQPRVEGLYDRYGVGAGDVADEDDLVEADGDFAEMLRKRNFLQATVKHRVLRRGASVFLYVYLQSGPEYRFEFEEARAFDRRELIDALDLAKAAEPSAAALADRIAAYYQKRAYLDVRVAPREEERESGAIRLITFEIHEGDPVRVVERRFPCLPADAPDGLGAGQLGDEIDATLQEELPGRSVLAAVDEKLADDQLSPGGGTRALGRRPAPEAVYHPESYKHALEHVEQLLHAKGYLNAIVGPVTVVRARCNPKRAGCHPVPLPPLPAPACRSDALDLPLPETTPSEPLGCTPDPRRGVRCAPTVLLSIPVHLGPATVLYDVVFEGSAREPKDLLATSELELGAPLSQLGVEAARTRLQNAYADDGYAYATVRADVEYSPDRTRARARYTIAPHEPVVIAGYEVRGARRTDEKLILSRLSLCKALDKCSEEERYYRRALVRQSEEQIAGLGTFSSVSIALEDADIPQRQKRVVITVVEQAAQYIEPRFGFSTGEGARFAFEYGHRNVAGQAIALSIILSLGYLPDFLILDDGVRANLGALSLGDRLTRQNIISLRFPNIGLGPRVALTLDGFDLRANQRDFGYTKEGILPVLSYRPVRQLTLQLGTSVELNDVGVFKSSANNLDDLLTKRPSLTTLLRVPEGRTLALSQRLSANWDRRDNPFAATRGTLLTAAVEHVTAFPLEDIARRCREDPADLSCGHSEFLRITARTAGYIRITEKGLALALTVAGGYNLQLKPDSVTYPDRAFQMGGFDTHRGFALYSVVPEDIARRICTPPGCKPGELQIGDVTVRAGDFYVNPRAELRIPVTDVFSLGVFLDTGNVWKDPKLIQSAADFFTLRYATGAGLRAATPIGPIAFDGGVNLARRPWEDIGAVHFSIGLF